MKANIYDIVNQQIIDQLEKGVVAWRMPWKSELPQNLLTKKAYRGMNVFTLHLIAHVKGYQSPYWATYKQISEKGGQVKKGEKSTPIGFYKLIDSDEIDQKTGKFKTIWLFRYYSVFNTDQSDLILKSEKREFNPIEEAEKVLPAYKDAPEIRYGGGRAYYQPKEDYIQLPPKNSYTSDHEYYSTLFHELTHSTAHEKRLDRKESVSEIHFGSENYSKEELIAEMGNSYLSAITGILPATLENSAAYIQGWLKALKNDNKLLFTAGSKAQKAVDYIYGTEENV